VRLLTLREFEASSPIELSVEHRDALRALVPDLTVEPASGPTNAYVITPGSWIGSVALHDLAVEIQPKLLIQRVLLLLSYSIGLARWGDQSFDVTAPDSLIEALVPVFAWHLERALCRGVLQGYRTEETALLGVRGRVRFDEQLRRRFAVPMPVEVRFDDFTEDTLENRLLKAAIATLGRLRIRSESSRRTLRRFDQALELVSLDMYDPRDVPRVLYTRLNHHYQGAVEWARLILRFASFESRHGRAVATTVLFDMNAVFEDFVRTALREELGLTLRECPSGRECPSIFLDAGQRISLDPDLSWWAGKTCRLVGDVKYKMVNMAGVKHPDLYQLLAYVTATGLTHGVLVYAASEGKPTVHELRQAGKFLHVRGLDPRGRVDDIRNQIRVLASTFRDLSIQNSRAA
jgi:5-methylcytosine-specific restriction enzyme subunit McrC